MLQSDISGTFSTETARAHIIGLLQTERFASRRALSLRLCQDFNFLDAKGDWQVSGCMKALYALENKVAEIVLPAAASAPPKNAPRLLDTAVAPAHEVPQKLCDIQGLYVEAVSAVGQRTIWNTLIAHEHPQGMTTFAGCQVRYLIGSDHGWLGAVGFSAAARRLRARDQWIGWDDAKRRLWLSAVICLSRFLLRVRVPHLASHVLGQVLRDLPLEFESRYGYRPMLVESYADAGYHGTCLRAANFVRVGESAGRGRQDVDNRHAKSVKTVLMYALDSNWRRRLEVPQVDHAPELEPGCGLDAQSFAQNEFGDAPLGDRRLSRRLVESVARLAAYPGAKINAHSQSDRTFMNAFYRLIEKPAESEVTVGNILHTHRERTVCRMRSQRTVLAVQDGTDLNFGTRPGCEGLQIIGKNQTKAKSLGLHLHATLAVSGEGMPLGVLRLGFDSDKVKRHLSQADRVRGKQVKAKLGFRPKTQRWIDALEDVSQATREVSGKTRVISVCDREGDVFEIFDAQRRGVRVELLVRAKHDRNLTKTGAKLFAVLRGGEAQGYQDVPIEGLTARPKSSRKKARPARTKRLARCAVRFRSVVLPPTGDLIDAEPIAVSGIHLVETTPPEDEAAVEWFLLTTVAIEDFSSAAQMIQYYVYRWRIEEFFRVLKSGCKAEFLLFRTADRLQRAIAINAVIGWRIMVMTRLGREVPDTEPQLMFTDEELSFLGSYASRHKLTGPARLGDAVKLVAHYGGHREGKHRSDPGDQIMWTGYSRLSSATIGHQYGMEDGYRDGYRQGFKDGY